MPTQIEPQHDAANDNRRQHPQLRAIYPDARDLIDHFFRHRHEWAGSSINFVAQRVVHEAYPMLRAEDVMLLVAAIERVHKVWGDEAARMDEIVTHYTLHALR
jgi:hypothetical protein